MVVFLTSLISRKFLNRMCPADDTEYSTSELFDWWIKKFSSCICAIYGRFNGDLLRLESDAWS